MKNCLLSFPEQWPGESRVPERPGTLVWQWFVAVGFLQGKPWFFVEQVFDDANERHGVGGAGDQYHFGHHTHLVTGGAVSNKPSTWLEMAGVMVGVSLQMVGTNFDT